MYEIKVDLNGDAVEGLTYRLTFDSRDGASNQRKVLRRLAGASATDPHAVGTVVAQGTTGEKVTTSDGLRVWAGRAGDPFWIQPDVLHAVGHAIQDGTRLSRSPCSTTSNKRFALKGQEIRWAKCAPNVLPKRNRVFVRQIYNLPLANIKRTSTTLSDCGSI
jgi:hypothetical protein